MKKAIIYIYDYIGSDAVNANYIRQIVTQFEDQDIHDFEVHINSMGGSVFEGIAIYNFLKTKNVEVYVDGVAASIASVIAMCGKKIFMYSSSMMMVHNPWTWSDGDAEELIKQAEMLEQVKKSILAAYKERTKLTDAQLTDIMNNETWMTASEAKKQGFCDEVVKIKSFAKEYVACFAMVNDESNFNKNKDTKMNKNLLAFFGLPENATEAQIEAKLVGLRKDFGLEDTATIEDVLAKMKEALPEIKPAEKVEAQAKSEDAKPNAQLEELLNDRAEEVVNAAIKDFKILAVDKDVWLKELKSDFKTTKANLDSRAVGLVKPGKVEVKKTNVDPNAKVDPIEAASNYFKEVGRGK